MRKPSKKKVHRFGAVITTLSPLVTVLACSNVVIGDPSIAVSGHIDVSAFKNMLGEGSSSVKPIIDAVSPFIGSGFQYSATGSGNGLKVATGAIAKDFGMSSALKNPNDSQKAYWENEKVRTITFAQDAIGVALNLPSSIKLNSENRPVVDGAQLGRLFDKDSTNDNVTWDDLLINPEADNNLQTVNIFGREGGKSTSGTADGFFHSMPAVTGLDKSNLDNNHDQLPATQKTGEANAVAKNTLVQNDSSLTYLSLGFALENEEENLVVATIKTSSDELWVPSMENVLQKTYKWTRPFNIMFSLNNPKALAFAKFLFLEATQLTISDLNFVQLTQAQIDIQSASLNLNKADVDLVDDVTTDVLGLA